MSSTSDRLPLERLLRRRRMIRSFADEPVDIAVIDELCDLARRAPSAGHTAATEYVVLDRPDDVAAYWNTTMSARGREQFRWQGLLRAPALVIVLTRPDAYVQRYAEPDKARPGLGSSTDAWAQPFWWVDAGAVIENFLLLCVERDLGACLFGVFDHEAAVKERFDVPDDRRIVATIALGHLPNGGSEPPGRSAGRPRPSLDEIRHRGRWQSSG